MLESQDEEKKKKKNNPSRTPECKPRLKNLKWLEQLETRVYEHISGKQSFGHGIAKVRYVKWSSILPSKQKKKSKKTTTTTYSQISNTFYWTNKDWNQKVSFTPWRSGQSRCYYKSEKLVSDRLIFFQRAMRGFIILWR